ncbi:glycerol dehydratase reactivation factor, small subunit [Geosporobacter subterraneus DSM 17957]|uniref:Glycerol dehydratase reactivation factor, small subunit n=1 Tax=Geosporobacter subterraneus DSM 17957 TaxID=1121919 RepID=A0A1M6LQ05_9FIRM|nr:glycerol dehydratase reactivase beta/small subunit family protein [Geosporobacter subterraneus]SHJ73265.1 glycerol dehydratase reactivation factor, small subunit [Geosporobacter subterraneus DSM 17957]
MATNTKMTKPHIPVYFHQDSIDTASFTHVIWGIEEEGIPYVIEGKRGESSLELGYMAAEESNLGVGIGIGKDGWVILHYNKLQKGHPLLQVKLGDGEERLRSIGANGARLVKGIPFKSI